MDPIETWHDAPMFEAMENKIKALEAALKDIAYGHLWADDRPSSGRMIQIAHAALERK